MNEPTCDHVWRLDSDYTGSRIKSNGEPILTFNEWNELPQEMVRVSKFYCEKCRVIIEDRTVLYEFVNQALMPSKRQRWWHGLSLR